MKAGKKADKVSFFIFKLINKLQFLTYEIYLSFALIVLGFLDNNIIFLVFAFIAMIVNFYARIQKVNVIYMTIGEGNENEANRLSFLYKIKFVLYMLLTMIAASLFVLNIFGTYDILNQIKIINLA